MNIQHAYGTLSLSLLKLKLDCAAAAARGLCCPHRHFGRGAHTDGPPPPRRRSKVRMCSKVRLCL